MKTKLTMIMLIASFLCAQAQEWNWLEDKQLSIAREGLSATAMDDSIFFSGGRLYNTSYINTVDIYDVGEDLWSSVDLESQDRFYSVAASCNGKVFFAGGINLSPPIINCNDVDVYDKNTGEWTVIYLSQGRHFIGAVANGNKVYFAGGLILNGGNFSYTDVIDVYDTETEIWDTLFLTEPKAGVGAATVGSKVIFGGGGISPYTHTDLVEIYDVNTGEWAYDTLSEARTLPATVAYQNKVYFAGGMLPNAFSSDTVDIYNVDTETWDDSQSLSFPRIARALKVKDALVFAGETDYISSGGSYGPANGIIDIYYPETGEWITLEQGLNPARIWYGCAAYDNKAYFAGGWPGGTSLTDLVSILEYQSFHCLPQGVTFTSQAEIDNFQVNYPNCIEIEGDIEINGDDITNLSELEVLTAIGGDLKINSNDALTSLTGLDSISSIGGELRIVFNQSLTDITGLENIEPGSITNLSIVYNSNLSNCDVWSICQYLSDTSATAEIHNNADTCNSRDEIQEDCNTITFVEELTTNETIIISPNPLKSTSKIQYTLHCESHITLKILDLSGREMAILVNEVQQPVVHNVIFDTRRLPAGIYFCVLKTSDGVQTRKIVKL